MKTITKALAAVVVTAATVGAVAPAGAANPVNWTLTPTSSQPETANNTITNHSVTVQATVFTGSVWSTVSSNNGPYSQTVGLFDSSGGAQARQVNGTNTINGNVILLAPFFTTVVNGQGILTSN